METINNTNHVETDKEIVWTFKLDGIMEDNRRMFALRNDNTTTLLDIGEEIDAQKLADSSGKAINIIRDTGKKNENDTPIYEVADVVNPKPTTPKNSFAEIEAETAAKLSDFAIQNEIGLDIVMADFAQEMVHLARICSHIHDEDIIGERQEA